MTQLVHHEIKTRPGVVVRQWPYRVPEARRKAIEEEVGRMLRDHIIEESHSPWSSPIVIYLAGRHFVLVTDHAPLQWMAKAKDTNARVTRWFLSLQDFSFQVQHRAGTHHGNADGLSRRDALWAQHTTAVGSELGGVLWRQAGTQEIKIAPPAVMRKRQFRFSATKCFGRPESMWRRGGAADTLTAREWCTAWKNSTIRQARGEYKRTIFHSKRERSISEHVTPNASDGSAPP
ncbi:uncharacterized protein LOC128619596 [Ictalurus furcatus]|uniref:uncharacterized protein LOC128619596 n=1 Tax=Ictalurus furcatus TaxID=66913 RepID=UPI00235024BF|nr:uncharacterized protein LOC128619596 [Ictalurus furcatus]